MSYSLVLRSVSACVLWLATAQSGVSAAELSPADFARQAREFLLSRAAGEQGTAYIDVALPATERLAPCTRSEFFLPGGQLRPRLSVGIRCIAPQPWVSYTQASIRIEGSYYVASRSLEPGTVLAAEDLQARDGDLLRLPPSAVSDPTPLLGQIVTHRVAAGAPIKASALRSPHAVTRGQTVRLEARGAGFVASSDGTALQGGKPGEQIQVRVASGQSVSAVVIDAHTAQVML